MKMKENKNIGSAYMLYLLCTGVAMRLFSDLGYSTILTIATGVQCLGFYSLLLKVKRSKSMAGISVRTLELYRIMLVARLASTCTRNGYVPVDRSGDFVYQLGDFGSLVICCLLIQYASSGSLRATYQEEYDTLDVTKFMPACCILGVFVHGHLNDCFFFDTLWAISTNLDTIAMLPQLWMMSKIGGEVEGMTAHFVAAIFVSRGCSFAFWLYAYSSISHGSGPNIAGYQLLACHVVQLFLSADFLYYYGMARYKGSKLTLGDASGRIQI